MGLADRTARTTRRLSLSKLLLYAASGTLLAATIVLVQAGHVSTLAKSVGSTLQAASAASPPEFTVRVVDPKGKPLSTFEAMLRASEHGGSRWKTGARGEVVFTGPRLRESWAIDVLVRAEGYASTYARFTGSERKELFAGEATVTMRPGEDIQLRLRTPEGRRLPEEFVPDVYFAAHRDSVVPMWTPKNEHVYPDHLPDQNFFGVRRNDEGRLTFRVADDTKPFHVAVDCPGVLRFFEQGPFTPKDVEDGILQIDFPESASLHVGFDPDTAMTASIPFDKITMTVNGKDRYRANDTYVELASHDGEVGRQKMQVDDLAPGTYHVRISMDTRRNAPKTPSSSTKHPGIYHDSKQVTLESNETRDVLFHYVPFDPDVFRGERSAVIRFVRPEGKAAAGRNVSVNYVDERYGFLKVSSGQTSEKGTLKVRGITRRKSKDSLFDTYHVKVDGRRVGGFTLSKDASPQRFTFRLPPRAGDIAPNIDLVNVSTGTRSQLHDLRGQVVCLEYWATWCGPCQKSVPDLLELASDRPESWEDSVVFVPLSIDERPKEVSRHVRRHGWNKVDHFWNGADGATGTDAPASEAFVVDGIPELFIIDPEGRIVWRGHPKNNAEVVSHIEEALPK